MFQRCLVKGQIFVKFCGTLVASGMKNVSLLRRILISITTRISPHHRRHTRLVLKPTRSTIFSLNILRSVFSPISLAECFSKLIRIRGLLATSGYQTMHHSQRFVDYHLLFPSLFTAFLDVSGTLNRHSIVMNSMPGPFT